MSVRAVFQLLWVCVIFPMASYGGSFSVLTFNTFLTTTPFGAHIAPEIKARLKKIPDLVASTGADIIALQEVWDSDMRQILVRAFSLRGYPHHFYSVREPMSWEEGLFREHGDGLLILSRFEIDRVPKLNPKNTMSFSAGTEFVDAFTNKGAIRVKIKVPSLGWIDFVNTHFGSVSFLEEGGKFNPSQAYDQEAQVLDFAEWIESLEEREEVLVVAGDFNRHFLDYRPNGHLSGGPLVSGGYVGEFSYPYWVMADEDQLGLVDTFLAHIFDKEDFEAPLLFDEFYDVGITFDPMNPYVSRGYFGNDPKGRIDYVFMNKNSLIEVESSKVVLNEVGRSIVSDHYGVFTNFRVIEHTTDQLVDAR